MATIDNTLIKALARAFRWQKLLEKGTFSCLDVIAKAERIGPSFDSRVIRLALLAPDIVEGILAGKQPAHLTLRDLMQPFPVEWAGQRLQFGIAGAVELCAVGGVFIQMTPRYGDTVDMLRRDRYMSR